MEMIYRKQFSITDLHVDCFLRLKKSVLLYFAQEVAADHAAQLGTGWETLNEKHLFWAVIRHKVQITRLPVSGETITVETWPLPATRVAYPRATIAYDAQGKELFRTMALWVLMDTKTRAMVLPGKSGVDVPGIVRNLEADIPCSIVPKSLAHTIVHTVGYATLDRNGHMNNTRYLDWLDDLLPAEFHKNNPAKEFTVCYLSEAKEGQRITVDWQLSEAGLLSVETHRQKGENTDSRERVFAAYVQF